MTDTQTNIGPPDSAALSGDGAGAARRNVASAPSALDRAEAVRDGLRAKLDDARQKLIEIDNRRASLAFDAHANGGGAKVELDKLNKSRGAQELDIENLESAIIEASRRIADAERDDEAAMLSEKAARAMVIAGSLVERGRKLDKALAIVAAESIAFQNDLRELNHGLGCAFPHEHQLQSLGERAVKTALMFSAFKLEHLAPRERYTFAELCESWGAQIERWADARLPNS